MITHKSHSADTLADTYTLSVAQEQPGSGNHRTATLKQRSLHLPEIFAHARINEDLKCIEQMLLERSRSHSELITAAGIHTMQAGGKRLRAALALLAAHMGDYDLDRVSPAATSVELIHTASLVHDDLIDQAAQRRGHTTVHARWNNDVALMVGDYFFALGAAEMARSPDARVISYYAQAVQTIVEGELSPVTDVAPQEKALEQYFYKIGCKTAVLFAAACKAGMATGGGSDADIATLGQYGYDFGLAFQIIDDVLDFTGDEALLGKPAGNDLRQGTITLPLIYAVASGGSALLHEIIDMPEPSDAQVRQVVAEVRTLGGVDKARADAVRYVDRAIAYLEQFAPSPTRRALADLALFVLERQS